MTIPVGGISLLNLDVGADRPDLARVELHRVVQVVNEMIAKGIIYADGEQSGTGTQRFGMLKVGSESSAPWHSATRAVDIGSLSAIFQTSGGVAGVARNMYTDDDGVTWRYRATGVAQLLYFGTGGEVSIYTAPSAGGAGTVASLSSRLQITNTGVVTFGGGTAWHSGAPNEYANHPVSGYVRVGTGKYMRTTAMSLTNLTFNVLTAIPAPAGAAGLILNVYCAVGASNVVGYRNVRVCAYGDAGGTVDSAYVRAAAREEIAVASGTPICETDTQIIVPVVGGNAYIKWFISNGSSNVAQYAIVGYTV